MSITRVCLWQLVNKGRQRAPPDSRNNGAGRKHLFDKYLQPSRPPGALDLCRVITEPSRVELSGHGEVSDRESSRLSTVTRLTRTSALSCSPSLGFSVFFWWGFIYLLATSKIISGLGVDF